MTSIKIIKAVGGKHEGETHDVSPGAAAYLVAAGYAEQAETAAKRGRPRKSDESESV